MNEFSRLEKLAKQLKLEYPKGTRIELEQMGSDPRPIESGMRGTVDHVDDLATIHCVFDNGRRLGLIYDEDQFHKLTPREVFEEKLEKISEEKQVRFIDTSKGIDKADVTDHSQPVTVTLLVNQEQAELLSEYEKTASMHFTLEYRGDSATAQQYLDEQQAYFDSKAGKER